MREQQPPSKRPAQVSAWLRSWFAAKGASLDAGDHVLRANFFDLGVIDSLGLLELIAGLEEAFGFRFDERHLQDPRFPTVAGLAEIVSEAARAE